MRHCGECRSFEVRLIRCRVQTEGDDRGLRLLSRLQDRRNVKRRSSGREAVFPAGELLLDESDTWSSHSHPLYKAENMLDPR